MQISIVLLLSFLIFLATTKNHKVFIVKSNAFKSNILQASWNIRFSNQRIIIPIVSWPYRFKDVVSSEGSPQSSKQSKR
ncbi:hypothetical protein WALSEDRAFT_61411 [Wallemia mellicola CBS 633.66]|uniref:Secreted protein n=1 Tax=Wallemia mellicola (strain ATCC MYA-4683 / CBS 633.66) TaxID=671144 RepID=I4Y6L9_WALMC|nr:hypothetical protein WALSEDRAFT_61411 [Wallemia mellicola CBS 633.66]EIM19611.1 hypothetical protein WALSEDRAFT_61411 [Wallemia mellicola CBS 633.66]|eukprot:XP_006960408.1 hypothetical protein WALSEDRAFT_61411 [Wallemia mellicola CBS 633.66]